MKLRGGYDLRLAGRPSSAVEVLPEPEVLYLPLRSRRFRFTELCVEDGARVQPGQVLARDPASHGVPLLAPRAGRVDLEAAAGHVTLRDVALAPEEPYHPDEHADHVPTDTSSAGMKRYRLVELGAWQFLRDAHTSRPPNPYETPRAAIISTLQLESFRARGKPQLLKRLSHFTRGLEQIQALVEYQPIYLVLPDVRSEFARQVRETLRGYASMTMVEVPLQYPADDFAVLARNLGLKSKGEGPVWALRTEGVLAVDRALTLSRPCTVRLIALGGPAVREPRHLKAMPGYPLRELLESRVSKDGPVRVLNGGALTGEAILPEQLGLDVECDGLTVLPEHAEREFLGFMRPGLDRRSYSRCFLSRVRRAFDERLTTALYGEPRPCVACGFCEEVCPANLMPHLIHKALYGDELEEVERLGADLCVGCGLCSYVCPSKIELRDQFLEARERIESELHAPEPDAPAEEVSA